MTESRELFEPGSVIELANSTELHQFEEVIRNAIKPNIVPRVLQLWQARSPLKDELRPLKFNGTTTNISLQVMDDPLQSYITARDRGFAFKFGQASTLSEQKIEEGFTTNQALGFVYAATAKSSGRGVVGQIQAELWYYAKSGDNEINFGPIQRIVSKPRIESEKFMDLEKNSRRIGLAVLKESIKNTRPQGFHN